MEKVQYKKSDFYYDLPEERIAQTPAEPRDSSRLLVYDRKTKTIEDKDTRMWPMSINTREVKK